MAKTAANKKMHEFWQRALYVVLFSAFAFVSLYPIALLLGNTLAAEGQVYTGVAVLFAAVIPMATLAAQIFGKKKAWLQLAVLAVPTFGISALLFAGWSGLFLAYAAAALAVVAVCHVAARGSTIYTTAPFFPFMGFITYGIVFVLGALATRIFPILAHLTWSAGVYLALAAYFLTAQGIAQAVISRKGQTERQSAPAPLRRGLFLTTTGVVALVALLVNVKGIWSWISGAVYAVAQWVIGLILKVAEWLKQFARTDGATAPEEYHDPMIIPQGESPFWLTFSKVLEVVLSVVAVCILLWFIWFVGKKVYRLVKNWIKKYLSWFQDEGGDFADEQEDLLNWGDVKRAARQRYRRFTDCFAPREQWRDQQTQRDKVRFLYRQVLRKKKDPSLARLTPNQLAAQNPLPQRQAQMDSLADLYNRARYSSQPLAEGSAEALKEIAK